MLNVQIILPVKIKNAKIHVLVLVDMVLNVWFQITMQIVFVLQELLEILLKVVIPLSNLVRI